MSVTAQVIILAVAVIFGALMLASLPHTLHYHRHAEALLFGGKHPRAKSWCDTCNHRRGQSKREEREQ